MKDGGKKLADANKAMRKAQRLANRALDFEEDDDSVSSDYELVMAASGAIEKSIGVSSTYNATFVVPAKSSFVWKARVKRNDIGFAVREVRERDSIDIESLEKYRFDNPIQGIPHNQNNIFF